MARKRLCTRWAKYPSSRCRFVRCSFHLRGKGAEVQATLIIITIIIMIITILIVIVIVIVIVILAMMIYSD